MEYIFRNVIAFTGQVMEARLKRLDLLGQQAERKKNIDKCCAAIQCCLDRQSVSNKVRELEYYFHK